MKFAGGAAVPPLPRVGRLRGRCRCCCCRKASSL